MVSENAADSEAGPRTPYRDEAPSISSENTVTYEEGALDPTSEPYDPLLYSSSQPRVRKYLPPPVERIASAIATWAKGPQPPRIWKIEPFFPQVQTAPIELLNRHFPKKKHKIGLYIVVCICWFISFSLVLHKSAFSGDVPGYGSPIRMSCTSRFWSDGNGCGLNGDLCRPFNNTSIPFRCPADCKRAQVVNPHAVGDQEINYRNLVVGGPTDDHDSLASAVYRADSFVCGAGIHSGFISDKKGGCGVIQLIGEHEKYSSVKRNGISSIAFDSYFPLSFTFLPGTEAQCQDLRWPLLGVSLTFTILLSLFTTNPAVFFPTVFIGIFFHVALVSDPPTFSDYYSIVSIALGRFLPAAFCAFVIYKTAIRRTHLGLRAQIEKTVLWLGACWVGALNNYTFDKIPIQRLTPTDLKQPGAIPALIIIVLTIFFIALGQAWALRIEGRFLRYLAIYATMGAVILLLVAVPGMNVRIHHYILALLLLPGTAMQNRPSLLYQGLLVGLFINGIARWGFDSILQTPFELRGDAPVGSLLPALLPPIIHNNAGIPGLKANITFEWAYPLPGRYDGVSVLVNDVERFRGYEDLGADSFTWVRHEEGLREYFRFAYMSGSETGDYTKAGVWDGAGGWIPMKKGPS